MATVLTVSLCFTALTTHRGAEQCGEVYGSILLLVLLYGIFRNVDMMFTFRRWKWLLGFVKYLEDLITRYREWATLGEDGHCFCRTWYLGRSRINHRQSRKFCDFENNEDYSVSANALSAPASVARGRSHWKEPGALQSSLSLTITLTFWTCDIETDYHMRISIPWHLHPNKPWQ